MCDLTLIRMIPADLSKLLLVPATTFTLRRVASAQQYVTDDAWLTSISTIGDTRP